MKLLYLEIVNRADGKKVRKEFVSEKDLWEYMERNNLLSNLNVTLRKVYEF